MGLTRLMRWFAGDGAYMDLVHCMGHDRAWIGLTVALDLAVATGYALIAKHWWDNQRRIPDSPAKLALGNMRNIFLFCGICGYLFIPIKMVWPAWRLYDLFMVALVYFTWKYAWGARDLKVVYNELGRSRQLALDLEESRAEARRKTFFLNAIGHDLRTPLNGVLLQAELAGMESDDPEVVREALAEIRETAKAAGELLDRLLELGWLDWSGEPAAPTTFALAEALASVATSARAMAEPKGLTFAVGSPPGLAVRTDRMKLERILQNLAQNAIKFTSRGGVEIGARASGSDLVVDVEDTGVGIAPERVDRLFDEFYQVDNRERDKANGFGLGLSIARRLAHQLGGELAVESTPGRGSRFTLLVPGAVAGSAAGAVPGPLRDGRGAGLPAAPSAAG